APGSACSSVIRFLSGPAASSAKELRDLLHHSVHGSFFCDLNLHSVLFCLTRSLLPNAHSADAAVIHLSHCPGKSSHCRAAGKCHRIDPAIFQHLPDLLSQQRIHLADSAVQRDILDCEPCRSQRRNQILRSLLCSGDQDMAALPCLRRQLSAQLCRTVYSGHKVREDPPLRKRSARGGSDRCNLCLTRTAEQLPQIHPQLCELFKEDGYSDGAGKHEPFFSAFETEPLQSILQNRVRRDRFRADRRHLDHLSPKIAQTPRKR